MSPAGFASLTAFLLASFASLAVFSCGLLQSVVSRYGRGLPLVLALLHKGQRDPGVDAEQDHEQRLHRVDDQHEIERRRVGDAIEHEHRLDGEMPGSGAVGRGDDDRYRSYDEADQRAGQSEVRRLLEAEEGEVEMEEIARPDRQAIQDEQRDVAHAAERGDAEPNPLQRLLHLFIYGERAEEEVGEDQRGDGTDGRDDPSHRGETRKYVVDACARAREECAEDVELHEEGQPRDDRDDQGIDHALRHHRADGLGKGRAVPFAEHAAARHLAHAGDDEAHGVGEIDGEHADPLARMLADGRERLLPAPSPEGLRQYAEGQGEDHPGPVHLVGQHLPDAAEIKVPVHPVEYRATQQQGQRHLHNAIDMLITVHFGEQR